jgi:hypothetical protein
MRRQRRLLKAEPGISRTTVAGVLLFHRIGDATPAALLHIRGGSFVSIAEGEEVFLCRCGD